MAKKTAKGGWKSAAKKVVLGTIGAACLARQAAVEVLEKCVARGEELEPELKKRLSSLVKRTAKTREGFARKVTTTVKGWRERLPVATKRELETLTRRVEQLTKRVERAPRAPKAEVPATA